MQTTPMIIDGRAVAGERTLGVINPADGEVFAAVPQATPAQVDLAVAAAQAAFPAWSKTPDGERQRLLHALGDALQAHLPELMQLVTQESGKPLNGLAGIGAGMEVGGAIAWTHVTADLDLPVEVIQDNAEARVEVHRKPLGVVASITPWNWPLLIAIWHVIPALRAGNTVVIKPSEYTPLATLRFVELANELLPPGVLNAVTGDGEAGAALAQHPGVAKIVFTGSTATGRKIMQAAAGNLKRLTLELGGNDAGIVLPDVDVKAIASKLLAATLHNNGQTCACLKRLYVHDSLYDELCAELARLAAATVVGDGLAPETQLGPLQNREQLAVVEELADDARRRGARFLCGGHRLERPGYFYAPTVIADADDGMRVVAKEQFGPLVPVLRYRDVDDAIARANASEAGLGGSVWGADPARAAELAQRLECGTAWVNEHGAVQPDAPFGGVKQSGIGVEFGRHGLAEYTSLQTVKVMKG
ncbi:aldehyde dehydrogenase family protein [Azospira restricta]|uniref:Aldehyde dehydrogenase family protein n=1 Tax=Azospira restricta TaxID=404405 RepID=A0A974PXA1_9RHOO|nr:aldehyde dehydrogenase family protein [Azospira restricta]QRJ62853.1 aldehyde dehydrogenase family protein [Azospira restricta]